MSFGNTFVDVLKRLVGVSKETPVVDLDTHATDTSIEPEPDSEPDDDDDSLRPTSPRDEWEDMQAFVARCEAEAIDLGGIDLESPESFWRHYRAIEPTEDNPCEGDDASREARAQAAGFADLHHWEWVSQYCQIKWSELVEDCDPPEIRAKPSFSAAAQLLCSRPA